MENICLKIEIASIIYVRQSSSTECILEKKKVFQKSIVNIYVYLLSKYSISMIYPQL